MIKVNKRNVIDVQDWDELVVNTYGKIYSFQQQFGCQDRGIFNIYISDEELEEDFMHDEIPLKINGDKMGVKFDVWLKTDPDEHKKKMNWSKYQVELFWERNFYPDIEILANDLYRKGLIEKGEYDINIDW